jgi:phenylacetate-coenzyme A ligase PaaK-like adenylate-forming protein
VRSAIENKIQSFIPKWNYSQNYSVYSLNALNNALARVSIYKDWKKFDPGSLGPLDLRFASLPVLTKKDILVHSNRELLPEDMDLYGAISRGEVSLVATSGSTDDKIVNVWYQKWWDASEKSSWRLNSVLNGVATGNPREAILVNPKNVGIISDEVDLPMETRRLSRFLYLNEKTDPVSWSAELMDRMIEELNIFQPDVLEANPSYLARLSRYFTAHRKSVFQPGVIVFTYEYPALFHYRQIRQVFQSPMASSYGTTETGYVFIQCECGKFHQNSDFCRVDFQPFKAEHGGPYLGRILVTPLNNPWNYFIRFDTGDIVHLEESGRCACGRNSGMILSSVNGRQANLTLTCHGRLVTLFELDNVLGGFEDLDSYQLVQPEPGAYQLFVESRNPDKENLDRRISLALKTLYGDEAKIIIIHEKDIPPETSGKYLLSRASFSLNIEDYLDDRYFFKKT